MKLVITTNCADALKENGIGRPSTRAAIIETLFKRNYIRKEKKNLIATPTGVELIQLIHEELLKSAELTGIWEKKLREIEKRTYDARQFLEELKQMVSEIVTSVLSDNTNPSHYHTGNCGTNSRRKAEERAQKTYPQTGCSKEKKQEEKSAEKAVEGSGKEGVPVTGETDLLVGQPCPVCGKGTIIKGKAAYGCSEWKNGCTFRRAFD